MCFQKGIKNYGFGLAAFQLSVGPTQANPQDFASEFDLFINSSDAVNSTSTDISGTFFCPNSSNYFSDSATLTFANSLPHIQADYGDKDIVMKLCVKTVDNSNINLISPAFKVKGKAFSDSGTTPLGDGGGIITNDDPTYAVFGETTYSGTFLNTSSSPLNVDTSNTIVYLRWTFATIPALTPMPFFGVKVEPAQLF